MSRRPHTSPFLYWFNFGLGHLFFLMSRWYVHAVYPHKQWLPTISPEQFSAGIDFSWGVFTSSALIPLARGKLDFLIHPRKHLVTDKPNPLCQPRLTLVAAGALIVATATILLQPALHLKYNDATSSGEHQLFVYINGSRQELQGSSVPVFDMNDATIVVTDRYNLYRRAVTVEDGEFGIIPRHKFVDLDGFLPSRNTAVTLIDRAADIDDTFAITYEPDINLGNQCSPGIVRNDATCADLLRTVLDTIAADTTNRLFGDKAGIITYSGKLYRYGYSVGVGDLENSLVIRTATVFADDSRNAFRHYFAFTDDERDVEVGTFREDYGSLSQAGHRRVFDELFDAYDLESYLQSDNPTEKSGALSFVRDVLVPGTSHVAPRVFENLVSNRLASLVGDEDGEVSMLAIAVGINLSESNDALWKLTVDAIRARLGDARVSDAEVIIYMVNNAIQRADDGASVRTIDAVVDLMNVIRKRLGEMTPSSRDAEMMQAIAIVDRHVAAQLTRNLQPSRATAQTVVERWERVGCPIAPERVDCELFSFRWSSRR